MTTALFSISEAIKIGWQGMKTNFWKWAGVLAVGGAVLLLPGAIEYLITGLTSGFEPRSQREVSSTAVLFFGTWVTLVANIISWLLQTIITIGFITMALKAVDGKPPSFRDFKSNVGKLLEMLAVNVLYGLIVFAGILLLIIPGIIWGIKYQFAPYFVIDRGLGPIEALKASAAATAGEKLNLLAFSIVAGMINFAGALALLFGLFATMPTTMIALAYVYRKLADRPK